MQNTPSRRDLSYAEEEIRLIEENLPDAIERTIFLHPTKVDVMEEIRRCSIAHFACHGEVASDPSMSRILLSDWETTPLTVAEVALVTLKNPQLAYLSACHTANTRRLELLDEAIHLARAFQLAGFPSVIGTLWQVADCTSATVAADVYHAMISNDRLDVSKAAAGLHFAVRRIKDSLSFSRGRKVTEPLTWAAYIHVGV
jgi:CHAT domain-containing protein